MSEQRDPPRWKDGSADAWPDGFHEAIATYARTTPSAQAQNRMLDRLEAEVDATVPAAGGGGRLAWWVAAGGLLAAALVAWLGPSPSPAPPAPAPAHVQSPVPTESTPRAEDLPVPHTIASPLAPGPKLEEAPARVAPRARVAPTPRSPELAPPTPAAATGGARAELELLIRARSIVSSAPAQALALANEHAARYPQSAFSEEREVLAIQAERRLGHTAAAVERTRRFLREHPSSVHRPAVESGAGD